MLSEERVTPKTVFNPYADFRRGFLDTLPLGIGVAPFGIAYALAAQTVGLNPAQIQAMSLLVFAGSAQTAATSLIAGGVDVISIILATLIINLRHLLYSASLALPLRSFSWWRKMIISYFLVDEAYALTIKRVSDQERGVGLFFGAGVGLYVCWQLSTLTGILLGSLIPDPTALGLQLVFPLSFTVLLLPYLRSKPGWAAAITAAILAVSLKFLLPGKWYLLLAAIGGCLVGGILEGLQKERNRND